MIQQSPLTGRPEELNMRIAVIGAGISGLVTAYLLSEEHESSYMRPTTTSVGTPTPSMYP